MILFVIMFNKELLFSSFFFFDVIKVWSIVGSWLRSGFKEYNLFV